VLARETALLAQETEQFELKKARKEASTSEKNQDLATKKPRRPVAKQRSHTKKTDKQLEQDADPSDSGSERETMELTWKGTPKSRKRKNTGDKSKNTEDKSKNTEDKSKKRKKK
jgi:hypothetical protein